MSSSYISSAAASSAEAKMKVVLGKNDSSTIAITYLLIIIKESISVALLYMIKI